MGYDIRTIEIRVRISRHNSQRDINDDNAFDELLERACELAKEFEQIDASISWHMFDR